MSKKVFDIIPPAKIPCQDKLGEKQIKQKSSIFKRQERIQPPVFPQKKKSKFRKAFLKTLIACFLFLILVGIFGFFIFSKSKIEIWPETEILTLAETIIIDLDQKQLDIDKKIIPGEIFKDQKIGSQEFPSSGRILKEEKAKGVIRVYNEYSTSSQGLLANTRFVSVDGKLFRSVKKEVIPGGRYEGGKFISGEVDVEVQAAEAGEDYNIGASTFSIPGFAGTPKYTAFYGKSFSPMTEGFKGEIPQADQEDLDKARNILKERLEKESKGFLQTALPTGFILLDETISQEIIEENYSIEAGAGVGSFVLQIKIESSGIIFKKSDIEDFAKNLINLNISEDKKFQEESLEINYSSWTIKEKGKTSFLDLEAKAKVYSDIDLDKLKKTLLGRSFQEVEIFLKNQPQILKVEIDPGPFWRKKIPENMDKVEIKMNLD